VPSGYSKGEGGRKGRKRKAGGKRGGFSSPERGFGCLLSSTAARPVAFADHLGGKGRGKKKKRKGRGGGEHSRHGRGRDRVFYVVIYLDTQEDPSPGRPNMCRLARGKRGGGGGGRKKGKGKGKEEGGKGHDAMVDLVS